MNRRGFLGSAGTAAAVSLTGCAAVRFTRSVSLDGGAYPQHYYDAANTNSSDTRGPETDPVVYWTKEHESPVYFIDNGQVYLGDVVLDAADGTETGQFDGLLAPQVVSDGVVYGLTRGGGELLAFDAETNEELWKGTPSVPASMSFRTATAAGDSLLIKGYVDTEDDNHAVLMSFDASTGEHLWTRSQGSISIRPPAMDGDTVLEVKEDGLHALSVEDGSVRWAVESDRFVPSPTVSNGSVYTLWYDGTRGGMHAFDAENGSKLWSRKINATGPCAASGDTLYLTTHPDVIEPKRDLSESRLVALNAETGDMRWEQQTPVLTTPTVADGTLYVGGRPELQTGLIAAYDAESGEDRWRFTRSVDTSTDTGPKPANVSWPAVVDGYAFAWIEDTLYALGE